MAEAEHPPPHSKSFCTHCKPHLGICSIGYTSVFHELWRDIPSAPRFTSCRLPDTVVYLERGDPAWFFSSVQNGAVLKKNRFNSSEKNIQDAFLKDRAAGDAVASLIYERPGGATSDSSSVDVIVEYLTEEGLADVLVRRIPHLLVPKPCILQKFVEPKGQQNFVLQVTWTPQRCIVDRRINNSKYFDRKISIYDRLCTVEGSEQLAQNIPLAAPALCAKLDHICTDIAGRCSSAYNGCAVVRKMTAYFKIDSRDRIHFLWCSDFFITPTFTKKETTMMFHFAISYTRSVSISLPPDAYPKPEPRVYERKPLDDGAVQHRSCPSCLRLLAASEPTFEVSFKAAVLSFIHGGGRVAAAVEPKQRHGNAIHSEPNATGGISSHHRSFNGRSSQPVSAPTSGDVVLGAVEMTSGTEPGDRNETDAGQEASAWGRAAWEIPPVLRRVEPSLTFDRYCQVRTHPSFLYSTFQACQACGETFMRSAEQQVASEERLLGISSARAEAERTASLRRLEESIVRHQGRHRRGRPSVSGSDPSAPSTARTYTASTAGIPSTTLPESQRDRQEDLYEDDDFETVSTHSRSTTSRSQSRTLRQPSSSQQELQRSGKLVIDLRPSTSPGRRPPARDTVFSRLSTPRLVTQKWEERKVALEQEKKDREDVERQRQERLLERLKLEEMALLKPRVASAHKIALPLMPFPKTKPLTKPFSVSVRQASAPASGCEATDGRAPASDAGDGHAPASSDAAAGEESAISGAAGSGPEETEGSAYQNDVWEMMSNAEERQALADALADDSVVED